MTTIYDIPVELLYRVFQLLSFQDLKECQKVSLTWYTPSHLVRLKEIHLSGQSAIESFISSIDHNPKPNYLKAVRAIYISSQENEMDSDYRLEKEDIKKLFHRFPNLATVKLVDSCLPWFAEMDDENLCKELIRDCPNIIDFEAEFPQDTDSILQSYNLRHVLTKLSVDDFHFDIALQFGSIIQFIASFPRLKKLRSYSDQIASLENLLLLVQALPNLTEVRLDVLEDNRKFAELFLANQTQEEKHVILDRLSKITHLVLEYPHSFCLNAVQFITKYMNNLEYFGLISNSNANWTDMHKEMFYNDIVNLLGTERGFINLQNLRPELWKHFLPTLISKTYVKTPLTQQKRTRKFLNVDLGCIDRDENRENIDLFVDLKEPEALRGMSISLRENFEYAIGNLFNLNKALKEVDEFTLSLAIKDENFFNVRITSYTKILEYMPLLKKVELDVPRWLMQDEDPEYINGSFQHVEDVTFRGTAKAQFGYFISLAPQLFPNLMNLSLYYYDGMLNMDVGEIMVSLGKFKLNRLTVDMTPVKGKMTKFLGKETFGEEDFFVLELKMLESGERCLYKVFLDLSIIKINDSDLKGFVCGKDYLQFRIIINTLKCLELCMLNRTLKKYEAEKYLHEPLSKGESVFRVNVPFI